MVFSMHNVFFACVYAYVLWQLYMFGGWYMFASEYIVFPRTVSWHYYMRCESLVLYYAQCKIIYVETLINLRQILSITNMCTSMWSYQIIINCYIDVAGSITPLLHRTFICVILSQKRSLGLTKNNSSLVRGRFCAAYGLPTTQFSQQ